METYGTGYIPSPIDKRDLIMEGFLPLVLLTPEIDYSTNKVEVRFQGTKDTCVGFAFAAMKEYQELKEHKRYIQFSPLYLYQKCKEVDNIPDEGTHPRVAVKILHKEGICEESYHPYKTEEGIPPLPGAEENALQYRIHAYAQLTNVQAMKRSLSVNGPFVAGLPYVMTDWLVTASIDGMIPMPQNESKLRTGHAICIVGYDDDKQVFKFQNSWGPKWGDGGFGYLPYDYMEKYCKEAYGATDLVHNPEALVKQKEAVLLERGEEFVVSRDEADRYGIQ
ncbi:C1 family peptidase [Bacillus cabrialesii]|uniref:C1 family peptidase n=1 Tax=Bacillus cabrialesii TaxID=2487276 RepID=UPI0013755B54|nr:C1 family peptidase [Bacillus cabrialesii]UQE80251.1 C1 family peptidase [Bacillus cabrialesii]